MYRKVFVIYNNLLTIETHIRALLSYYRDKNLIKTYELIILTRSFKESLPHQ